MLQKKTVTKTPEIMRLNSLELDAFRGATVPVTINFDPAKKITMIFAENGNGKSTISDALTCLLTKDIGSINDKSGHDPKYLKTIGKDPAKIKLVSDAGTFSATISGNGKNIVKTPNTGLPKLRYLRRKQIVNLIEARPADRYEELKDFIDVNDVFKCEAELRKTNASAEKELETTVRIISQATETLEKAWGDEGEPDTDFLTWAELQSRKDVTELEKEAEKFNTLKTKWNDIVSRHVSYTNAKTNLQNAQSIFDAKTAELERVKRENEDQEISLLNLLEQAKDYIQSENEISICPVCSSDMQREAVLSSLTSRIKAMNALKTASDAVNSAKKELDSKQSALDNETTALNPLLLSYRDAINGFTDEHPAISNFVENIGDNTENNLTLFESDKLHLDNLALSIIRIEEDKTTELKQHNLIKTQFLSITENKDKAEKLQQLATASSSALEIVVSSRKEFTENILTEISGEIDRMYEIIHPNEEIGNLKLSLKSSGLSSLLLGAKFHTEEDIPPQSVYSESHLDTLGICIFLALAKTYGDTDTILILDDVVMSVDHNHLERFIELITDVSSSFSKIFITTHYQKFREQYKRHRAPGLSLQFIELRPWSLENGIRVLNGKVELEEFKSVLNNTDHFDRQAIASKSGVLLENILDFLSEIYEFSLPKRTSQKYTLGELLDALQPKYLKDIYVVHKVKVVDEDGNEVFTENTIPLQPTVEEIKKLAFIRNEVGAHFNLDQNVADSEIETFGNKTLELANLLICSETGELPLYRRLDHWSPKSNNIKLFPREKK